jgi:lysophospholipase L1-like esterase
MALYVTTPGMFELTTFGAQNVEAQPGNTISQVHTASLKSVEYQPNVIVIHAGTNDCRQHVDIANAGQRMSEMLDDLFGKVAGATVVLSTLIVSKNKDIEQDRGSVNDQYRALVEDRRKNKKDRIVLAEMDGAGDVFVQEGDLSSDGIHPTDAGHAKMGRIFSHVIVQAHADGLIVKPNHSDSVPENGKYDS